MPHAHHGPAVRLSAAVLTVSTTRTLADDASGDLLRDALVGAGHTLVDRALVPDDPARIGAALDGWIARPDVQLVLITGGTGVSARDCTPAVVRPRLTRELPGFGELFRMLSFAEVGAAAMLSDAVGGLAGGTLVFALPGSSKACRLGIERLILPELGHLARELVKETPLPRPAAAPVAPPGVPALPPVAPPAAPPAADLPPAPPHPPLPVTLGARAAGEHGVVLVPAAVPLPEGLPAAVLDVLRAAPATGRAERDGRRWAAFGFPDLSPRARVLLVHEDGEIVALHRWPRRVGAAGAGEGMLPRAGSDAAAAARSLGFAAEGPLVAMDARAVWVRDGDRVLRVDAAGARPVGRAAQVLASLVLEWSQR